MPPKFFGNYLTKNCKRLFPRRVFNIFEGDENNGEFPLEPSIFFQVPNIEALE